MLALAERTQYVGYFVVISSKSSMKTISVTDTPLHRTDLRPATPRPHSFPTFPLFHLIVLFSPTPATRGNRVLYHICDEPRTIGRGGSRDEQ
jgi:hypothetical protein